jgi:predicted ATPase
VVERERELAELSAAIDDACSGTGALMLIEGDPGIGKSRLCTATREAADAAGMRVLRARGGELERDLTYGIAKQLFERCVTELEGSVGECAVRPRAARGDCARP